MSAADTASLVDLVDQDPFKYYVGLREQGDIVWDPGMKAWVATTYAACREVFRHDQVTLSRADTVAGGDRYVQLNGKRHISLLQGTIHRSFHRWWVGAMSPRVAEGWRVEVVRPIIARLLEDLVSRSEAELVEDFARKLTIRVIAAVMALPADDDRWIQNCRAHMDGISEYIDAAYFTEDEATFQAALASHSALDAMLMPFIDARRDGQGNDLIATLWRDGPTIFDDWGVEDMLSTITTMFFAGTDTTSDAMSHALFLLLSTDGMIERLEEGGEPAVSRFAEEALRLFGAVQWRLRVATADFEVMGTTIKKGELIVPLNASANRDPSKFAHPEEVRLDRPNPRDHYAFNIGARLCAGAALARVEIQEGVQAAIRAFPNLRHDSAKDPVGYLGLNLRTHEPIHVRYGGSQATSSAS
jgi:cytochrome P450